MSDVAEELRQARTYRHVTKPSPIVKRSIVIMGHKTSVSLEREFWQGLGEIARDRNMTKGDLVMQIDSEREHGNLSSAIRVFVFVNS